MESNNTYVMESKLTSVMGSKICKMRSATGYCPRPLEAVSLFLCKKWTISIIITIGNFSTLRFNNLEKRLDNITSKTLTERLRELEKEKIILRKVYTEIPPRVEYSLTSKGIKLMKALKPLIKWAEERWIVLAQ